MTIGELAQLSGVTVRTIRHYEKIGLIAPSGRKANGYRVFDRQALVRVRMIRWFQGFGLSLEEIRRVIERPERTLSAMFERRQSEIRSQMEALRQTSERLLYWSKHLQKGPLEEEPLYQLTEAIMSLEKHFPKQTIEEMNHLHNQVGTEEQQTSRQRLEDLVREGRGAELRSLMERFLGSEGVAKAFSSVESLKSVLTQHQIEPSTKQLEALRKP